jgi:hypothetical protein
VGHDEGGRGELLVIAGVALAVIVALQVIAWIVGTVVTIVKLAAIVVIIGVAIRLALRDSPDD